ncbi:Spy0128 family protein [Bifidobacterium tissieri]|uniref:VWA domain-containing protein n=1 Tax=Bifidobacterium tissieri TaxID=1630162 RepID=A0A5M9ZIX9_9BIFI|nr:FctA domain-containing protein [Bifidobacterium tissieri]KAA8827554.1 VWA domain-containing protein [Bifidobacterium tissieri]KAA8831005.1 VWA domain-containing protein [Bifidobacterium tissieri]
MTRMKKNKKPGRVGGAGARLVAVASAVAMFLAVAVGGSAIAATPTNSASPSEITKTAVPKTVATNDGVSLGVPQHTKIVNAPDKDGKYTVSLNVTGAVDSSTSTTSKPLDIVLVLDESGSMENSISYSDRTTKQQALVTAVDSFLDMTAKANEQLPANAEKHQVSLVKFASDKSDQIGNDTNWRGYNYSQIVSGFTTDFNGLRNTVGQLKPSGATRADYGLQKAQDVLRNKRADAKQVVLFFTDGVPTSQRDFDNQVASDAITAAREMKQAGTDIYSVGVVDGADPGNTTDKSVNSFLNAVSSNYPNATLTKDNWNRWNWNLGQGGNQGYYQSASSAEELKSVFDKIQQQITTTVLYQGVRIEDALSKDNWVTFTGANNAPEFTYSKTVNGKTTDYTPDNKATVDGNGKIVWYPEGQNGQLEAGTTYTVNFTVKTTQKAYDAAAANHKDDSAATGNNNFYTNDNDTAKVFYKTVTSVNGQPTVSDENNTPYNKPLITLPTSTIIVTKTWADGNEQHGSDAVTVHLKQDGKNYGDAVTLNAADEWRHDFTVPAGPDGHQYTVTEQSVDGYDSSVSVSVSTAPSSADNGVITLKGLDEQKGAAAITNTASSVMLPAADLKVTKQVKGHAAANDFGFTLACETTNDQNAGSCKNVSGLDSNGQLRATVSKDVLAKSNDSAEASFGTTNQNLKFKVPSGSANEVVYTFKITENGADNAPAGWQYDTAEHIVTVTVAKNADGKWAATVSGNNPKFVNRYVAVAALPLTGGTTGRAWIVAAGVLLALAGGAGYVAWRRRMTI